MRGRNVAFRGVQGGILKLGFGRWVEKSKEAILCEEVEGRSGLVS
jgi:hypothetical protein